MAKVKITGHASGTGVITITAPNTSTDRTITLPDATATLATKENFLSTGIDDNASAVKLTVSDSGINVNGAVTSLAIKENDAGNVGFGTTPESWHNSLTAVQIGETGVLSGGNTAWGGYFEVGSNFYRDSNGFKYTSADKAVLTEYDNASGDINFKTAPAGSADAAVTLTTRLQIKNDGRGLSQFTAKAWINYEQVGTQTITDSHNVGSVTDVSAGVGIINFANNVGNTGYSVSVNSTVGATYSSVSENINSQTTSSYRIEHRENAGAQDADRMFSIVFGD